MRRLGLLTPACLLLLAGCARDNPAFDDCLGVDACVDESGDAGDGDGDGAPGDGAPGDGDGAPGDGDGAPGDGDGAPGDGDGVPGDGDGSPGDGDGDGEPGLPTCPNPDWVDIAVLEDTFLDGSYGLGCLLDLNMDPSNLPCAGLDFGGAHKRWVCGEAGCNSTWLGRFAIDDWMGLQAQVYEAGFVFTATVQSEEPNVAQAYALDIDGVEFGECGTWMAGPGVGAAPAMCVSTFMHSAWPSLWGLALQQIQQQVPIAASNVPAFGEPTDHMFVMPVDKALVQSWLDGQAAHTGVALRTGAFEPVHFNMYAQGSGHDPKLQVKLCVP